MPFVTFRRSKRKTHRNRKEKSLKKLFGGLKMTWPRLILFAVVSGIVTGLIALLVPEGNSIRQIAVTFEAWIVLAIIIVVNCEKPLEAACKTFVYFLISQPLVYLIQVPFSSIGWGLFGYYNIILKDPDGKAWPFPIEITKDGNTLNISY